MFTKLKRQSIRHKNLSLMYILEDHKKAYQELMEKKLLEQFNKQS